MSRARSILVVIYLNVKKRVIKEKIESSYIKRGVTDGSVSLSVCVMPTGKRAKESSAVVFLFSQYRREIAEAITKHSPTLFCFVLFCFFYL